MLAHHINIGGIDYDQWTARLEGQRSAIVNADISDFEGCIRRLLTELNTSHTAFYHELPTRFPPQHTLNATLTDVQQDGKAAWMFLDVFEGGPANRAGVQPGDLLLAIDGTAHVPPELPSFGIGSTYTLTLARRSDGVRSDLRVEVPYRKGTKERPPIVEPQSLSHRVVEPGVGLLKVTYFAGALGLRFTKELDLAMEDLKSRGCDRLIVDLRGNIGGGLGFARLASFLCPEKIAIGHSLTPSRLRTGYKLEQLPRVPMPSSRIGLALTLGQFAFKDKSLILLTQGLGKQPFHNRTAILINKWTNSAGEIAAAFVQENGLAVLIGKKTPGNVLGATNYSVGGGYWLRLPVFGWFTARGRMLEGIGVDPDREVAVDRQGLRQGLDVQLKEAIEVVNGL